MNNDLIVTVAGVAITTCEVVNVEDEGRGEATLQCQVKGRSAPRVVPEGIVGDVVVTNPVAIGGTGTLVGGFTTIDGNANETDLGVEADFCNLQFPLSPISSSVNEADDIFSQVFEAGLTDTNFAQAGGVLAQFGITDKAPIDVNSFAYVAASFNAASGGSNNDEYVFNFVSAVPGTFRFLFRYSLDGGLNWTHCDNDGAGSNGDLTFSLDNVGTIDVL